MDARFNSNNYLAPHRSNAFPTAIDYDHERA